ncbi:hypothetical protein [Roseomonas rosulenta]|uniref:hypothetical protein n=1 Tax=Roseomonas rosulenta TaxID=2748667 RepID=UPI001E622C9C|nr:hypothetical protein [Roseomonas rosulenta]
MKVAVAEVVAVRHATEAAEQDVPLLLRKASHPREPCSQSILQRAKPVAGLGMNLSLNAGERLQMPIHRRRLSLHPVSKCPLIKPIQNEAPA